MKTFFKKETDKFYKVSVSVVAAFILFVTGTAYLMAFPVVILFDYIKMKKERESAAKADVVRKQNIQTVKFAMDNLKKRGAA